MSTYSKKRKDPSGGGGGGGGIRKSLRQQRQAPPTLVSLQVVWTPDQNTESAFRWHISVTARLSSVTGVSIHQEFSDGLSIRDGADPGNLQFRTTVFIDDIEGSTQSPHTNSVSYDDYPGYYDDDFGIQADTDLKYVFGAQWQVRWRGQAIATTTPLFGTVTGAGQTRTFTPSVAVTATWNNTTGAWANQGALVGAFPAWGIYPTPAVNNDPPEEED